MFDFLMIVKEWGPSVGLLILMIIIIIPVVKWINKIDNRVKDHSHIMEEIQDDVENIHIRCHVPEGAVKKLEDRVSGLELQNARLDGELNKIDEHLKTLDNSVKEVKTGINSIINHFAIKGMGK